MTYVDSVEYFDSKEAHHKVYLDNTEEFPMTQNAGNTADLSEPTPEETVTPVLVYTPEPVATPAPTEAPTPEPLPVITAIFNDQQRTGTYDGEMAEGLPHGFGTFISTDNLPAMTYSGNWEKGIPAGDGSYRHTGTDS